MLKNKLQRVGGEEDIFYTTPLLIAGDRILKPSKVDLNITLDTQERSKGIYKNILYTNTIDFKAKFVFSDEEIKILQKRKPYIFIEPSDALEDLKVNEKALQDTTIISSKVL